MLLVTDSYRLHLPSFPPGSFSSDHHPERAEEGESTGSCSIVVISLAEVDSQGMGEAGHQVVRAAGEGAIHDERGTGRQPRLCHTSCGASYSP